MISIDRNRIMIEEYKDVIHVTSHEIKIKMNTGDITIKGQDLSVGALSKFEIYIVGRLEGIMFHYEK